MLLLKVKSTYCYDFYQLCPPKINLLANLKNHVQGTKHCKSMEDDAVAKTDHLLACTCKRGRPMMSYGSRAQNNQKDLHNWFKNFSASSEEGEYFFTGHVYFCWLYVLGFERAKLYVCG